MFFGQKLAIFPKGLVHGFGKKKTAIFHICILAKKWQEYVFDDILDRKNTFVDNRNNNLIK